MGNFGKLILGDGETVKLEFSLSKSSVEIGRAAQNDIVLQDEKVSRSHARIDCDEHGCTLVDLGSSNGCLVNGVRVEQQKLKPGDIIILGGSTLRYKEFEDQNDPGVTMLNTVADLNATLAKTALKTALNDVSSSRLVIHTLEKTWEVSMEGASLTVGRDPACDIFIDDLRLSRRHAQLEDKGSFFSIRDLNSTNGTWIGDRRIDVYTLSDGDEIRIGQARMVFKRGFKPQELTFVGSLKDKGIPGRRPVIIVPGLMGSQLWRGSERLWPNVRFLFSQPESLRLPEADNIEARGIVKEVVIIPNLIKQEQYSRLGDYLEEGLGYERGKDLFEFAYDWRLDVRKSSRKLAQAIESWNPAPPITIIAHSLGCLVSRYYVEQIGGKDKIGRLILLGGPHSGVPNAISLLRTGPDLLPFGLLGDRMRETLITFPSVYQILPTYACVVDQDGKYINLLEDESWLPEKQRPHLRMAREFRRELKKSSSVPAISIFGYGMKTITHVLVQRDSRGKWNKIDLTFETSGDDRIPESSGVLMGTEIHPVQQHHGALYVDNDVKMRLKLELMRTS
ncbi:MAG: FHA domain-containing protein [Chloroflexi bacterium]|nr:FHA domain-containing protein [Chloroflexota bacterium]